VISTLSYLYHYAAIKSHDKNTQVAAAILGSHDEILVCGANVFTNYEQSLLPIYQEKPLKYKVIEHAERVAIFVAAKLGIETNGRKMLATWACCPECARAIVLSGITDVYVHKQCYDRSPERWKDDLALGLDILKNGKVQFHFVDAIIGGGVINLFNGKIWTP